jgi:probable O-glycosylation ligase (exosortase A-associated)
MRCLTAAGAPILVTRRGQILLATGVCLAIALAWHTFHHPVVVLAAGLAPFALLGVLRMPFPVVLGFVVFSFFRIHEVIQPLYPLRIPQLLALGALGALAWGLWHRQIRVYWRPELTVFTGFFVLVTVGVLLATNRGAAIEAWTGTYSKIGIMVLAIAWLATSREAFRLTVRVVLGCGLLLAFVTLYNKANGIGLVEGTRATIARNLGSMLGDPNDLALTLLFPASFALAVLLSSGSRWFWRLTGALCYVTVVAAIVATQSRGGLLGIAAVTGLFAYRHVRSKVLLSVIGAVALAALFAVAGISDRASGGAHEEGIDESAMGRIYAWGAAFRMAVDHPVSGVGLNNFLANYWAYSAHWDGRNHAVHSTWFGVLAETGFVGLAVFLVMVAVTLIMVRRTASLLGPSQPGHVHEAHLVALGVEAGLIGFIVSGTFLTMGFLWPFYILLALAVAVGEFARRQTATPSQRVSQNAIRHADGAQGPDRGPSARVDQ